MIIKENKVLGLDMGSNSVGWALLNENSEGKVTKIIDLGVRIFTKAVEEKVPTPKNQKRRDMRLSRRVTQRRTRRKQKMTNYLLSLDLLPIEINDLNKRESALNNLGNPYFLRAKSLDELLSPYEFGRILLHFVARRGFLSSKKQLAGDLVDDPDTIEYLQELNQNTNTSKDNEEGQFKADIAVLRKQITEGNFRSLGEYLYSLDKDNQQHTTKRNRIHAGGHLRTDRQMYKDELNRIWQQQKSHFQQLPADFIKQIEKIIFYQRPLKLRKHRMGKCSLEPKNNRVSMPRLEFQQYRYLLDINNLRYGQVDEEIKPDEQKRQALIEHLEQNAKITVTELRKILQIDKRTRINLETKNLKGNTTASSIRQLLLEKWDNLEDNKKHQLVEDLLSIKKKSALKTRLINHWKFASETAIKLCLIEFEPGHGNLSLKAINKLLPYLKQGYRYDEARVKAGYDYEITKIEPLSTLPTPPITSNPIVNRGMHELRRVINAIIKEYGKPDIIRIEMARDLEMNTQRYKDFIKNQKDNEKANEEAQQKFSQQTGRTYAVRNDKIKYRLWIEQDKRCAYSGNAIAVSQLWTDDIEIDHIVPKSLCLDDSFNNKVICFTKENQNKSQQTPYEKWGNTDQWTQISQRINQFYPDRKATRYSKNITHPKKRQFYMTQEDIEKKYGESMSPSQLNDTRYISRLAQEYVKHLGCDVSVTKGVLVSVVRKILGFNNIKNLGVDNILSDSGKKERTDHRHHAIDAVVIACINRYTHNKLSHIYKNYEEDKIKLPFPTPYPNFRKEVEEKINQTIVSQSPIRKLTGALHEETGTGYIATHKALVYRKTINSEFESKHVKKITDYTVKQLVSTHLSKYDNNAKIAFSTENIQKLTHKDGKTPIRRVRVKQSTIRVPKNKTAQDILQKSKLGIRDKAGKIFRWMTYGNTHHVEIIQHKESGNISGCFVTMMEANKRAKGIDMPKQAIIKENHGEEFQFLMALHINDTLSILNEQDQRVYYRVQEIDLNNNKFSLRILSTTSVKNKEEGLSIPINNENFEKYQPMLHKINAIGKKIK